MRPADVCEEMVHKLCVTDFRLYFILFLQKQIEFLKIMHYT
jgi:hypothetical protein